MEAIVHYTIEGRLSQSRDHASVLSSDLVLFAYTFSYEDVDRLSVSVFEEIVQASVQEIQQEYSERPSTDKRFVIDHVDVREGSVLASVYFDLLSVDYNAVLHAVQQLQQSHPDLIVPLAWAVREITGGIMQGIGTDIWERCKSIFKKKNDNDVELPEPVDIWKTMIMTATTIAGEQGCTIASSLPLVLSNSQYASKHMLTNCGFSELTITSDRFLQKPLQVQLTQTRSVQQNVTIGNNNSTTVPSGASNLSPVAQNQHPIAITMFQTGDEIVVLASIPGGNPTQLAVAVENGELTIKGNISEGLLPNMPRPKHSYMQEHTVGAVSRTVKLPVAVKVDQIVAKYQDGLLVVHLPIAEEAKRREIKITMASSITADATAGVENSAGAQVQPEARGRAKP